jgi:hypothetical protein
MPKKPKPFVKSRIEISDGTGAKKTWREVVADSVEPGDLVRGHNRGLVENVEHFDEHVRLTYKNGSQETFYLDDKVTAFVKVTDGDS